MKFDLRVGMKILAFSLSVGVAFFLIAKAPAETSAEVISQFSRDVVLFICSLVVSWTISAWFAKKDTNEKIDTIAERSFEKMATLTLQVESIKKFLVDTIKLAQSESDPVGGLQAYKHRINGTIHSLDQITTSNETLAADWLGVVSSEMKIELKDKSTLLSKVPAVVNELSGSDDEIASTIDFDQNIRNLTREFTGAGRLISEFKRVPAKPRVAEVNQDFKGEQTKVRQSGTLTIDVRRSSYRATGTGSLNPPMLITPSLTVVLKSYPEQVSPTEIIFPAKTGTNYDFNIMLSRAARGEVLPIGAYVFEYDAECAEGEAVPSTTLLTN